jgi:aerobic carbon-monoxide dehydrogenase medium subunit
VKAAAFNYQRVHSIQEALALLANHGDNAKLIAGGQSLLPSLNMRLSNPEILIDLQGVAELKGITFEGGVVRIGAMTTHTEIQNSKIIQEQLPLLTEAVPHIAHRAIRNLGTWGGSCVLGDPAAEWPACAVALDAVMVIAGPKGQRKVSAKDFFLDLYTTALEADEILVASEFTISSAKRVHYFEELSRRHGDYAVTGLVCSMQLEQNKITQSRVVYFSVASIPLLAQGLQNVLQNQSISDLANPSLIGQAQHSVQAEIQTLSDLTNSAEMKKHLLGVLLERAMKRLAS